MAIFSFVNPATIFTPAAGSNFRVRDNGGEFVSIKPSTRPRGVKGETGFGTYAGDAVRVEAGLPAGDYGFKALKHGWLQLVPVTDATPHAVTISADPAPVAAQTDGDAGNGAE